MDVRLNQIDIIINSFLIIYQQYLLMGLLLKHTKTLPCIELHK